MKYRLDFVTNSSSSSFIGVFAEITNIDEATTIVAQHKDKMNMYDDAILTGERILNDMSGEWWYGYGADWAGVDLTPRRDEIDPNKFYLLWESYGGAGDDDSAFWIPEAEEMNYDVTFSDFTQAEQNIFCAITDSEAFKILHFGFGAGRNG